MQKVLIVDDDELHLVLMQNILERKGYSVVSTADGPRGIAMYEEHRPDLLLLDLGLPGMHGLDVLKEIRERDKNAKVLVVTGYGSPETVAIAQRYGAAGVVEKSGDLGELMKRISGLLAQGT